MMPQQNLTWEQRQSLARQQADREAALNAQMAQQFAAQGGQQAPPQGIPSAYGPSPIPGNVPNIPARAPQTPPFPGSNPQMQGDGLMGNTMAAIQKFFSPGKLSEAVPADKNPLMAGPGEGIGGRARREQIDAAVDDATGEDARKKKRR